MFEYAINSLLPSVYPAGNVNPFPKYAVPDMLKMLLGGIVPKFIEFPAETFSAYITFRLYVKSLLAMCIVPKVVSCNTEYVFNSVKSLLSREKRREILGSVQRIESLLRASAKSG